MSASQDTNSPMWDQSAKCTFRVAGYWPCGFPQSAHGPDDMVSSHAFTTTKPHCSTLDKDHLYQDGVCVDCGDRFMTEATLEAVKPEEIRLRLGQAFNGPHKTISREYVWKRDAPAMLREIERLRAEVSRLEAFCNSYVECEVPSICSLHPHHFSSTRPA